MSLIISIETNTILWLVLFYGRTHNIIYYSFYFHESLYKSIYCKSEAIIFFDNIILIQDSVIISLYRLKCVYIDLIISRK